MSIVESEAHPSQLTSISQVHEINNLVLSPPKETMSLEEAQILELKFLKSCCPCYKQACQKVSLGVKAQLYLLLLRLAAGSGEFWIHYSTLPQAFIRSASWA